MKLGLNISKHFSSTMLCYMYLLHNRSHTWDMSLTDIKLRLTKFDWKFLKSELLLEIGQKISHLAIIFIILNATERRKNITQNVRLEKNITDILIYSSN